MAASRSTATALTCPLPSSIRTIYPDRSEGGRSEEEGQHLFTIVGGRLDDNCEYREGVWLENVEIERIEPTE